MYSDISIIAMLDILPVVPAKVKDDMTAIRIILLRMI